jgi:arsenate reductase
MILYGLKNCDSCKKALAQLRAAGHEVAFVDIRTEPLDATQLADLLAHHGARYSAQSQINKLAQS